MNNQDRIEELLKKIEVLQGVHAHFKDEIEALKKELQALRDAVPEKGSREERVEVVEATTPAPSEERKKETGRVREKLTRNQEKKILGGVCAGMAQHYGTNLLLMRFLWVLFAFLFCAGALVYIVLWATLPKGDWAVPSEPAPQREAPTTAATPRPEDPKMRSDLERYIGENLISKIGIAVLVIGVGIGAKYSIENDLISPLVRILLGYAVGVVLGITAFRLRPKYENFSAVLLSGSMAILYFMTFAAFAFYDMLSPVTAFALMVLITVSTVVAALNYNRQFIAHLGLVGAYAVPFLLSEGKGQVEILFTYMAIINTGILVVALKKYWKPLYWVAFALTWIIVLSWYASSYEADLHFALTFVFGLVFFVLFYLTFLGYKLLQKEPFEAADIVLVLINSFVFYGLGYALLSGAPEWENSLGMYTLLHALLHALVAAFVYSRRGADKPIFFLVSGLVLLFVTLAIPVQLDGSWVTLLWLGEGVLLFWIGRTQDKSIYEKIAYPLLALAFFSLLQDWDTAYQMGMFNLAEERFPSLINITFLTSLLFCGGLAYLNALHYNKKYLPAFERGSGPDTLVSLALAGLLLGVTYFTFYHEISYYWEGRFVSSAIGGVGDEYGSGRNYDFKILKTLWVLLYFLGFTALLLWVNTQKVKSRLLGIITLCLAGGGLLYFLTVGLYDLSELRESYLLGDVVGEPIPDYYAMGLRYLAFVFVSALLWTGHRQLKALFDSGEYARVFELILSATLLWTASSELLHWLDFSGAQEQYKLALTIFWGIFALGISAYGIWKRKKHLRIAAMALFGATLLKLFFYDLADLPTLSKTIVFMSLGILLLLLSFLYNKFKESMEE